MTQEPYTVSILVPVYGVEKYIERCARSIFEQTYHNLDIVFVDDCTPDKSIDILKRVLDDYPKRKAQTRIIRHEQNRGLSAARNTGMDAAKGDYIYFVDSDDYITSDCIEILMAAMQTGDWDMVTADYKDIDLVRTPETPVKVVLHDAECYGEDVIRSFAAKWHWNAWNKLFSADYLKHYHFRFIEGIYFEDVPFCFKVACTAHAIKVFGKATYNYVYRASSISNKKNLEKYLRSYLKVVENMREVQKEYSAFSYDAEKWINLHEDKIVALAAQTTAPPNSKSIQDCVASTSVISGKSYAAIADLSASCHSTSTAFSPHHWATTGISGTDSGDEYKVSVLIPVYGVEKYVGQCARSIFDQTYRNLEIIFVDDHSPDNSLDVIKHVLLDYPEREKQVRILSHDFNRGLAAARNTAVAAATGMFVTHVDSDDWLERDAIDEMVKRQRETGAEIVSGQAIKHTKDGWFFMNRKACSEKSGFVLDMIGADDHHVVWGRLIKRSLYVDNHITAEEGVNYSEDYQVMPLLAYQTGSSAWIQNVVYHYDCSNESSLMNTSGVNMQKAINRELQDLKSCILISSYFEGKEKIYHDKSLDILEACANGLLMDSLHYRNHRAFQLVRKVIKNYNLKIYSKRLRLLGMNYMLALLSKA